MLQTGVAPLQSVFVAHPVEQVCAAVLQTCPLAQSLVERHCTQAPAAVSHTRALPAMQSPFLAHSTHAPLLQ